MKRKRKKIIKWVYAFFAAIVYMGTPGIAGIYTKNIFIALGLHIFLFSVFGIILPPILFKKRGKK